MKKFINGFFLVSMVFWFFAGVYLFVSKGVLPFGTFQMNALLMLLNACVAFVLSMFLQKDFLRWWAIAFVYVFLMAVLSLLDELGLFDLISFVYYLVFACLLWRARPTHT